MSRYTKHAPEDFPYEEYLPVANVDEYDAIGRLGKLEDIFYAPDGSELVTLDRLRELVEADRDGRCVVLPCKCGECEKYKSVSPKCGNCNRTTVIQHPEDYCNHGIRRENNEN